MAVASPYASYLEATGDGAFRWDLRSLAGFECHPGLVELGATVDFRLDAGIGRPRPRCTSRPPSGSRSRTRPGGTTRCGWRCARSRRTRRWSATSTGCTSPAGRCSRPSPGTASRPTIRCGGWCGPTCSARTAATTSSPRSSCPRAASSTSIFSLTHRGMCELFEATTGDFDLAAINPRARRGPPRAWPASRVDDPGSRQLERLYDVFLDHAERYLGRVLRVRRRPRERPGAGRVDRRPRRAPAARGAVGRRARRTTMAGVASLLATIVYLATVEHEITGSGLWDYQLWSDTSPVRVYEDGRRLPVDVYQRLVNANFNLNVHRTMLLDDALPGLAIDPAGAVGVPGAPAGPAGVPGRARSHRRRRRGGWSHAASRPTSTRSARPRGRRGSAGC